MRKLWTLGALVTACAFGWRQGSPTQAVELHAARGPLAGMVPEPRPSGAAERAVRRVVLSQALREIVSPSVEWSELPLLPSMLEALLSQRAPGEAARVGSDLEAAGEEPAGTVAAQCGPEPRGARAVGERTPPDALETLAELFEPSSAERPMPALH